MQDFVKEFFLVHFFKKFCIVLVNICTYIYIYKNGKYINKMYRMNLALAFTIQNSITDSSGILQYLTKN